MHQIKFKMKLSKWTLIRFILVYILTTCSSTFAQLLHDSRCYLENGGSSENFVVNEDIKVNSVIGRLRINGDPSKNGNINLSLRERDNNAPVEIDPYTKDLILTSRLDKEGEHGPASVYVNVLCDRLQTDGSIPSFIIPVNIRVQDVNDNAPKWVESSYKVSLSEVTVRGTRIFQGVQAVDADQPGPYSTVEYQVLQGPYSDFVDFVNPLEATLQLKKTLDYEQLKNFTVKLRAQDQGNPPKFSDTFLRVFITDADDQNPRFEYESYTAEFPSEGRTGRLRISPEPIRAWDQDEGIQSEIRYSINPTSESKFFSINPKSGEIDLITLYDTQKTTLVIKATQVDNIDRYALVTLAVMKDAAIREPATRNDKTIQVQGTSSTNLHPVNVYTTENISPSKSSLQFIQKRFEARVREDVPAGARLIALPTNKPSERFLKYSITDISTPDMFEIGQFGEVILKRSLDYEKAIRHTFHVSVTDGLSNTTCEVVIDVINVNEWDPRFRQPHYTFKLPIMNENDNLTVPIQLGKIEAADGDRNENINFNLRGQYSRHFAIDKSGVIWLRDPFDEMRRKDISLIATAVDSGQRSVSVPVTFTMEPDVVKSKVSLSFFGIFAALIICFILIVILISIVVYKRKSSQVHSSLPSSIQSSAGLVHHQEKKLTNAHHLVDTSQQEHLNFAHCGLSPGTSPVSASAAEGSHQTISSLVKAGYRGKMYAANSATSQRSQHLQTKNEDIEKDSISNSDATRDLNIISRNELHRSKKLSWQHEDFQRNELRGSVDLNDSTENNLIVYF